MEQIISKMGNPQICKILLSDIHKNQVKHNIVVQNHDENLHTLML